MLTPTKVINSDSIQAQQHFEQQNNMVPQSQNVQNITTNNYLNNIPPELQNEVLSKKNMIKFGDASSVQNFGNEIIEASARFTSNNTSVIKLGNAGSIGDKINEMLRTTKSLDTSKLLDDKEPGFFSKLFGKAKSNIEEFRNDQKSINESLNQIGRNLINDKNKLQDENRKLEEMFVQNSKNIKMFDVIVAAGMIRQEELKSEVQSIQQKAQATSSPEDVNEFRMAESFMRQLDVRISNIQSARAIAILQSPQIRDMIESNSMQMENIQSMVSIGIPAWHQQISMLVSQLETKKSIETTNALKKSINDTMKENARIMGQNQVSIAEAANQSIIEIETIQQVQNELLTTMDRVKQINEQGKQKRQDSTQKLIEMEQELKQKMLQV